MIIAPLVAASLAAGSFAASIATGPNPERGDIAPRGVPVQTYVSAVTDCIVRTIAADPRSRQASADAMIGELIVDSMPACAGQVRELIDAYDASFGDGTGEAFFMGPYLDVLPGAASRLLRGSHTP